MNAMNTSCWPPGYRPPFVTPPIAVRCNEVTRHLTAIALFALVGCGDARRPLARGGMSPDTDSSHQLLELRQVRAQDLPTDFYVRGAALHESGLAVAWAINHHEILILDGRNVQAIGHEQLSKPLAAAFTPDRKAVSVVDSARRSVLLFSTEGVLLNARPLGVDGTLGHAASSDGRSWLMLVQRDGAWRLERENGRPGSPINVDNMLGEDQALSLHVFDSVAVLGLRRAPFTSWRMDEGESALRFTNPTNAPAFVRLTERYGHRSSWVASPIVSIEDGFLQSFGSLGSDVRVLVRFGRDGDVVQVRTLDVPIGLLATAPSSRLALIVRATDRRELVWYEWQWRVSGVRRPPTPREPRRLGS